MTRSTRDATAHRGRAGLLLLRGPVPEVTAWASRGVVPVTVAPLPGWTAVLPRGDSHVQAPYDDTLMLLAARRLPRALRPAIGFFAIQDRAVITVHRPGPRRLRWVVWEPGRGVVRPPGLRQATPAHLLNAAAGGVRDELLELLGERRVTPPRLLAALVTVLELPGARLLTDQREVDGIDGAVDRDPDAAQVGYFEDAVRDAVRLRREMEQA